MKKIIIFNILISVIFLTGCTQHKTENFKQVNTNKYEYTSDSYYYNEEMDHYKFKSFDDIPDVYKNYYKHLIPRLKLGIESIDKLLTYPIIDQYDDKLYININKNKQIYDETIPLVSNISKTNFYIGLGSINNIYTPQTSVDGLNEYKKYYLELYNNKMRAASIYYEAIDSRLYKTNQLYKSIKKENDTPGIEDEIVTNISYIRSICIEQWELMQEWSDIYLKKNRTKSEEVYLNKLSKRIIDLENKLAELY